MRRFFISPRSFYHRLRYVSPQKSERKSAQRDSKVFVSADFCLISRSVGGERNFCLRASALKVISICRGGYDESDELTTCEQKKKTRKEKAKAKSHNFRKRFLYREEAKKKVFLLFFFLHPGLSVAIHQRWSPSVWNFQFFHSERSKRGKSFFPLWFPSSSIQMSRVRKLFYWRWMELEKCGKGSD